MKVIRFLFDRLLLPLIVALLTPAVLGFASKLRTGEWINLFGRVSPMFWRVFATFIFLWIVVVLVRARLREVRRRNSPPKVLVSGTSLLGWKSVMKVRYAGVMWIVKAPVSESSSSFNPTKVPASGIRVVIPPRCPRCGTELEESFSFWGWYVWQCVGCGFRRRSREGFYREGERAERIARREWEVLHREGRGG